MMTAEQAREIRKQKEIAWAKDIIGSAIEYAANNGERECCVCFQRMQVPLDACFPVYEELKESGYEVEKRKTKFINEETREPVYEYWARW